MLNGSGDDDLVANRSNQSEVIKIRQYALRRNQTKLFLQSTMSLPKVEEELLMMKGCKKRCNVLKFFNSTAGLLAAVRPCGLIIHFTGILLVFT